MRIDVFSIFPEYLAPLKLSLIGKAMDAGILSVAVHDLREFTHDRHRTVDDTPYGGGAGMVMKPEPWAEALESVFAESTSTDARPVLLVPSPAGEVFTQAMARELATAQHLVVACGRYEGIDHRVSEWSAEHADVRFVSIGDYVLNGGEVAAMVMIEAIARLIPGTIGNPESLTEESHEDGLLEYPVYTKPASWRGHDVPEILLSGNHGAIARWRRDRRLERTRAVRPEMLEALPAEALDKKDRAFLASLEEAEREAADHEAVPSAGGDAPDLGSSASGA